jgi:hypothetical protein
MPVSGVTTPLRLTQSTEKKATKVFFAMNEKLRVTISTNGLVIISDPSVQPFGPIYSEL